MTVTHAGSDQLPVSPVGVRHMALNPRASQRVLVVGFPLAECGDAPAKPAAPAAYCEAWFETLRRGAPGPFRPPSPDSTPPTRDRFAMSALAIAVMAAELIYFVVTTLFDLHPLNNAGAATAAEKRQEVAINLPIMAAPIVLLAIGTAVGSPWVDYGAVAVQAVILVGGDAAVVDALPRRSHDAVGNCGLGRE